MKGGWVIAHSLGETARLPAPFSFLFLTNQGMESLCHPFHQNGLQWAQSTRMFMEAIFKNNDPKQNFCLHRSLTSSILLQLEGANAVSQVPDSFTNIRSPRLSFQPSPGT